jgi:hypothetical protein
MLLMYWQRLADAPSKLPNHNRAAMQALGLPECITLRCVLLELSTSEEEVLFTSLLDTEQYPPRRIWDALCLALGGRNLF